jgi:hypothetical protein
MAWYFIPGLQFQAKMGLFLGAIMSVNTLAALSLHPLMSMLIKPKFMRRSVNVEDGALLDAVVAARVE